MGQSDEAKRTRVAANAAETGSGTGYAKSIVTSAAMCSKGAQKQENPQAASVSCTVPVRPSMKAKMISKAMLPDMQAKIAGL
mmetsp:Transcript_41256/g.101273  ORF Transcript_41256/g.101273 Transcript_41256/m.101273 type:complete len:82 (-) Transcript_41256:1058-1303(-)